MSIRSDRILRLHLGESPPANDAVVIVNAQSGRVLDADRATVDADGTIVQLYGREAAGLPWRRWWVVPVEQYAPDGGASHPFRDAPLHFDLLIVSPIEYAVRYHGTRYVLLAGDGSRVPVRYRFTKEATDPAVGALAGWHDGSYNPSDLYYANLYRRDRTTFATWDANGDGHYNEQQWGGPPLDVTFNPDDVDGYPDVAVGRIPAHTLQELGVYLDKVVAYEAAADVRGPRPFLFLADGNYSGSEEMSDSLKAAIGGGVAASTPSFVFNTMNDATLRPGWLRAGSSTLNAFARTALWISYIGHGASDGWVVPSGDAEAVGKLDNQGNLPIVFAAACETGRFAPNPPMGPYKDGAGNFRHFWYHRDEPVASGREIEERNESGGTVRYWPRPLTVRTPGPFDFSTARNRTFATAWLFNERGGAVACFGEVVVCENDKGRDLEAACFTALTGAPARLGDAWLLAQRHYW